jgi:hypothetical protein
MNIVLTRQQFKNEHVYFCDPINNSIMEHSKFIKLIYSNDLFTLNGLCILLDLNIIYEESYFKKTKYNFDLNINNEVLHDIYNIEKNILNKYHNTNKNIKYCIYDSLSNGYLKTFPHPDKTKKKSHIFTLKISGIWESDDECGLTFKIINS